MPWDRGGPNPFVAEVLARVNGTGRSAVIVGCALGDDAELAAARGFDTIAFDVAPTAIARAKARFPDTRVDYRVADLLEAPAEWAGAFDYVIEAITVQAMPVEVRSEAIAAITSFVAPGGELLVVTYAREEDEEVDGPPWPLTRAELDRFAAGGLETGKVEALDSRFRATFTRAAAQ